MDDIIFYDHCRPLVVAVLALCLDRLLLRRMFHLLNRAYRSNLPHRISRDSPFVIRDLGISLARFQPRRHGMRVVWRTDLDRRDMRVPHDHVYLDIV